MSITKNTKYKSVIVFSGGGTRYSIYCGMHAALQDLDRTPDLVIGACGGAIATTIINSFDTNEKRKEYLTSRELYDFTCNIRLTEERKLHRIGWYCLQKMYKQQNAPFIENVFDKYLVDLDADISKQLPSLVTKTGQNIKSIIIGSQILFERSEVNQKRKGRKLYKKVLFTDSEIARKIKLNELQIESDNYTRSAIEPTVEIETNIPMHIAMRISISDMFYVEPVTYQSKCYAGGAIDLVPIELAQSLGEIIFLEKKGRYTAIEEALVRAVLGYSGNQRLKAVNKQKVDYWIDTSDATQSLQGYYCKKNIDWAKLQVTISLPQSYQQFVDNMSMQWQYGYNKVKQQFAK